MHSLQKIKYIASRKPRRRRIKARRLLNLDNEFYRLNGVDIRTVKAETYDKFEYAIYPDFSLKYYDAIWLKIKDFYHRSDDILMSDKIVRWLREGTKAGKSGELIKNARRSVFTHIMKDEKNNIKFKTWNYQKIVELKILSSTDFEATGRWLKQMTFYTLKPREFKKLAMMVNSDRGVQVREYFLDVEVIRNAWKFYQSFHRQQESKIAKMIAERERDLWKFETERTLNKFKALQARMGDDDDEKMEEPSEDEEEVEDEEEEDEDEDEEEEDKENEDNSGMDIATVVRERDTLVESITTHHETLTQQLNRIQATVDSNTVDLRVIRQQNNNMLDDMRLLINERPESTASSPLAKYQFVHARFTETDDVEFVRYGFCRAQQGNVAQALRKWREEEDFVHVFRHLAISENMHFTQKYREMIEDVVDFENSAKCKFSTMDENDDSLGEKIDEILNAKKWVNGRDYDNLLE